MPQVIAKCLWPINKMVCSKLLLKPSRTFKKDEKELSFKSRNTIYNPFAMNLLCGTNLSMFIHPDGLD